MTPALRGTARRWVWLVQAVVAAVVVVLVGSALAHNWAAFRALKVSLAIRPAWIAGSAAAVFVTYALQIEAWRLILAGWSQHLGFGAAARTWTVANLGRYVPGKVWSVAGLVVLAQRAGVRAAPAAASAIVSQAITVGSGVAVVAAVAPHATSPLRLAAAALAAAATVGVLVWPPTARWLGRLANASAPIAPLRPGAALAAAALSAVAWLTYGGAFWLLARGLVASSALPLPLAAGVFALGYILGWLALFAPGGVGVRELVLVGLLTPFLGAGAALAVSVGSRVLLTVTEALSALVTLPFRDRPQESVVEQS
jgi:uncharacterized membrane protein YbhN (UPF0104 family)